MGVSSEGDLDLCVDEEGWERDDDDDTVSIFSSAISLEELSSISEAFCFFFFPYSQKFKLFFIKIDNDNKFAIDKDCSESWEFKHILISLGGITSVCQ